MICYDHGVHLERLERGDLPIIRRWRNNPHIWAWCRQRDLIDERSHEAWFARQSEDQTISMYKVVACVNGSPRTMVGVCGLTDIDALNGRAEFSLYIAPEHQQRGFAKAALKTLFTHGFREFRLNLIWGETFEGNRAAELFEGLGMTCEGVRREFYFKGGKFLDAKLFSVLASEWEYDT